MEIRIELTNLLIGGKRYAAFPPKEKPAQAGVTEEKGAYTSSHIKNLWRAAAELLETEA